MTILSFHILSPIVQLAAAGHSKNAMNRVFYSHVFSCEDMSRQQRVVVKLAIITRLGNAPALPMTTLFHSHTQD
jgi:hypothetical protein